MPTTTNFGWPAPVAADPANVPSDILALASAADTTLGSAWTSYTPSWTATGTAPVIGTGTIVGRFKLFAKWGIVRITMTAGGTTTFGTLLYRWSLPAGWTLSTATAIYGFGAIYDTSATTTYNASIWAPSTTTLSMRVSAGTTDVSATSPIAVPATGDIWQLLVLAELA